MVLVGHLSPVDHPMEMPSRYAVIELETAASWHRLEG